MTTCTTYALAAVLALVLPQAARAFEWQTATPESQGLSAELLGAWADGKREQ